jgi:hypothetical protein
VPPDSGLKLSGGPRRCAFAATTCSIVSYGRPAGRLSLIRYVALAPGPGVSSPPTPTS